MKPDKHSVAVSTQMVRCANCDINLKDFYEQLGEPIPIFPVEKFIWFCSETCMNEDELNYVERYQTKLHDKV